MKSPKKVVVIGVFSTLILGCFFFSITRFNTPGDSKGYAPDLQKLEAKAEKDDNIQDNVNTDLPIYETAEEAKAAILQEVEHKKNNEKVKTLYKNENDEIIEMFGIYETAKEAKVVIEQVIEHKESNEKVKALFKNGDGGIAEMLGIFETPEEARKIMQQELENPENKEVMKILFKSEEGEISTMHGMNRG